LRENVKSELQTFRSENFETKLSDLARYRNPKENHEDNNQVWGIKIFTYYIKTSINIL